MEAHVPGRTLVFEGWRFDRQTRLLFRADSSAIPVSVGSRALDILAVLLERPGTLVSKDTIMEAVWPGVAVEPNNLTVQIAALRRVLDNGRAGPGCVQTVPGRGYLFIAPVTTLDAAPVATIPRTSPVLAERTMPASPPDAGIAAAPRLSLVVLPFDNLGGNPHEDYLADAITEDLTTDLSGLPGALVIARTSAATYRGKSIDVRRVGQELGVRYAVEGSVRKLGDTLRVNVQLISTETSTHLWAGRFDQDAKDLGAGQDEIAHRLAAALGVELIAAESARSTQERPNNPDAFDLFLRARSAYGNQSPDAVALFERALRADPSSANAMVGLATALIDRYILAGNPDRGNEDLIERASDLTSAAATTEGNTARVVYLQGRLLYAQGHWSCAIATFHRVIERDPNHCDAFRRLGISKIAKGKADEAIPFLQRSIRLDPFSPGHKITCHFTGQALLLLGRDGELIEWHQRALAADVANPSMWRGGCNVFMAAAYALIGRREEARHAAAEAIRLWPFWTVRNFPPCARSPVGLPDPAVLAQMRHLQEGLRLAGVRDHAEEDADFGVAPDELLHTDLVGRTPTTVPGATTIRTPELVTLLARQKPLLLDAAIDSWGRSIPGAIGMQRAGYGASFSDRVQARFHRAMQDLTKGDLAAPTVVFCVNSERFSGYNLARRLVALGYTQIYWYRGGFESWQVNGLPEADLALQDW